jgi:hypothetical protein
MKYKVKTIVFDGGVCVCTTKNEEGYPMITFNKLKNKKHPGYKKLTNGDIDFPSLALRFISTLSIDGFINVLEANKRNMLVHNNKFEYMDEKVEV